MDAFYASVEIRDNPALRGKPVVVGGSPQGRGVICAASYEARKYGIHSAMPASQALRRCPHAVFVKGRMQHYAGISRQIREIFFSFTSLVEPLSMDEAFLDVSGCRRLFGTGEEIARSIKQKVFEQTGLIASAGVAPNKYLAKIASDLEKPDGLTVVDPDRVQDFLDPLPISRVWGIGPATEKKFTRLGVSTIRQLRSLSLDTLKHSWASTASTSIGWRGASTVAPWCLTESPNRFRTRKRLRSTLTITKCCWRGCESSAIKSPGDCVGTKYSLAPFS